MKRVSPVVGAAAASKRFDAADDRLFWTLAERFLAAGMAERGTMMGHACLRVDGAFFATVDGTGALIVKMTEHRVDELVADGTGQPFAPARRRFREWVRVPRRDRELWERLLRESRAFVAANRRP